MKFFLLSLIILMTFGFTEIQAQEHDDSIVCEAEICHEACLLMPNCTSMYEPEPINLLTIQTDKPSYNEAETISITGELSILAEIGNEVKINVFDHQGIILIPEQITTFTNNTHFYHDIITAYPAWIGYDDVITIQSQYGEYTADIQIHYSDYPAELSLTYLHDKVLTNNSTLSIHSTTLDDHASITSLQNETINSHDTILDSYDAMLESLNVKDATHLISIGDLNAEINNIDLHIETQNQETQQLINSLNSTITSQEQEIGGLDSLFATLNSTVTSQEQETDRLDSLIIILNDDKTSNDLQILQLGSTQTAIIDTLLQQQNTTDSHTISLEHLTWIDGNYLNIIGELYNMIDATDSNIESQNIETQHQLDSLNSTVISHDIELEGFSSMNTILIDLFAQQQNTTDSHETSIALNEADIVFQQEYTRGLSDNIFLLTQNIEFQDAEIVELNAEIEYLNTQLALHDGFFNTLTLQVAELLENCDDCDDTTETPPRTPRETPKINSFVNGRNNIGN